MNERSDTGRLPWWLELTPLARALRMRSDGTMSTPRPLTARERAAKKRRRKQAQQSKRANRKEQRR